MSACCPSPPRLAPSPRRTTIPAPGPPTTGTTHPEAALGHPNHPPRPGRIRAVQAVDQPDSHRQAALVASPTTADGTGLLEPAELVHRAAHGDPAAWQKIMRRYSGLVAAKVRSFRLQDADTLDAIQTTWLRLAENIHRLEHPERLGGWLATTAARECLRILRHTQRTLTMADDLIDARIEPSASPEHHVINAHTAQTLRTLIAQLPPRRRRLLRALFTDHPLSYAELSRTADIPPGSIGPTRNRALRQLRQMLHDHELLPPTEQ